MMPIVNWNHIQNMANRLNEQRKDGGVFCDVLLKVSGQLLPTHSCVLSACSPFFQGLICSDRPEPPHISSLPQEIELLMPPRTEPSGNSNNDSTRLKEQADLGLEAVIDLLDYIYTGTIELKEYSIEMVVQLAEAFMLDDLSSLLQSYRPESDDCTQKASDAVKKGPKVRAPSDSSAAVGQPESILSKLLLSSSTGLRSSSRQAKAQQARLQEERKQQETQKKTQQEKRQKLQQQRAYLPGRWPNGPKAQAKKTLPAAVSKTSSAPANPTRKATDSQDSPSMSWEPAASALFGGQKRPVDEEYGDCSPPRIVVKTEVESLPASPADSFRETEEDGDNSESGMEHNGSNSGATVHVGATVGKANKKRDRHPPFRCCKCDFVSSDLPAIRDHRRLHSDNRGLFVCLDCGFYTSRCSAMLLHLKLTAETGDHREVECSLCGFIAENRDELVEHLEKHEHRKPFYCMICERRCRDRSRLAEHMTMHAPDRPFSCNVCDARFKMKQCLRIHMWSHNKEKSYACDRCDFKTAYKYTLTMHARVHDGGMFYCPELYCGYSSNSKHSLRAHVQTHAKLKPFICEICGKKYSQACTLRRHVAGAHNPDGRSHKCSHCPFVTTRRDRLMVHFKTTHPDQDDPAH